MNKADENQYLSDFLKLWYFLELKDIQAIKQYCRNSDPAYKVICNFLVYLVEDRQNPRSFLLKSPKTEKDIEWLWRWDVILMRSQDDKILKLFPSGFAFRYIDEIFLLIERIPEISIDRLLTLNRYADGEYAEEIDDRIFVLFRDRPEMVYANWTFFRKHKKSLDRMVKMYFDEVPLMKKGFDRLCRSKKSDLKCKEIYNLLKGN